MKKRVQRNWSDLLWALVAFGALAWLATSIANSAEPAVTLDGQPFDGQVKLELISDQPESPTGREPKLLWTPAWQAGWQKAADENHRFWQYVKGRADAQRWNTNDAGHTALAIYQATGDTHYGRKAFERMRGSLLRVPGSTNEQRDWFARNVVFFDWLYPCLTPQERIDFQASFRLYQDYASTHTRFSDSDEAAGNWVGMALLDATVGSGFVSTNGGPAGGLWRDPTKGPRATLRNAMHDFIRLSEGGEYLESSQYNRRNVPRVLMGWHGLRTALGYDPQPELADWLPEYCLASVHLFTPDMRAVWQWGDVESSWIRTIDLLEFETTQRALAGGLLPTGHPLYRPYQGFLKELYDRPRGIEFMRETLLVVNPYATDDGDPDWRASVGLSHYCAGQRILLARDGWTPQSTLFTFHSPGGNNADHPVRTAGNFGLYRRGEWVLSHPLTYDGTGKSEASGSTHALLLANLPPFFANRDVVGRGEGAIDGVVYHWVISRCSGAFVGRKGALPWLRDWTRWICWLGSKDDSSDVVLVRDYTDIDVDLIDPARARYQSPYADFVKAFMDGLAPLRQVVIHSRWPIAEDLSWVTDTGQVGRIIPLSPAQRAEVHGPDYWSGRLATWQMSTDERRWHVRLSADNRLPESLSVNAIAISNDHASQPAVTLQPDGTVLVKRAGYQDIRVGFDRGTMKLHAR